MNLLPWVLLLVLDDAFEVATNHRFSTEEACVTMGEKVTIGIILDLQIVNHTITFKCVQEP
jgi:hypothetical protein